MDEITLYNYSMQKPTYSYKHIPTGQLYLASVLERAGYDVGFNDFQFLNPPNMEGVISHLGNSADIIAISCMSNLLAPLIFSVNGLKKIHPEKTIILGGPGPTLVAEEVLKVSPNIDIIVRGEGERTIVELMEYLQKGKDLGDVRGITYRDGNRIRTNPPRPRIENLDELPFPAYDKIDIKDYDVVGIVTSRGCPFRCSFCSSELLWGKMVKYRGMQNVMEEINLLHDKYKIDDIKISDDVFTLDRKRVVDFCSRIKGEKNDISWGCFSKIDIINEQLMKKMSGSGCRRVFYGIESGSDRILEMINKGFRAKLAEDVIKKSSKHFQKIVASFIWGFPFETMKDFRKTLSMADRLNSRFDVDIKLHLLTPNVGTPIYARYKNKLLPSGHSRLFTNLPSVGGTFSEVFSLLEMGKMVFEEFRNYPDIIANYYIYKTPKIEEKIKMILTFLKKRNLYISMVKGNLYIK